MRKEVEFLKHDADPMTLGVTRAAELHTLQLIPATTLSWSKRSKGPP
jgi:hypothetical protein